VPVNVLGQLLDVFLAKCQTCHDHDGSGRTSVGQSLFVRADSDLIMKMQIELVEAICGFQKVIKTLDNRSLVITSLPGDVIKNDQAKSIDGEGLPIYKNPFEKGRLIIQFQVAFPDSIPVNVIPTLESCLPPRPQIQIPIEHEDVEMTNFNPHEQQGRRGGHRQAYDEGEEYQQGPRIQQCATN